MVPLPILFRSLWVAALFGGAVLAAAVLPPGSEAADRQLRYVALGDSITAAAYLPDEAYPRSYGELLENELGVSVEVMNFGEGGATSGDLAFRVQHDATLREAIETTDIVTVFIGMNDVLQALQRYLDGTCGAGDAQMCVSETTAAFGANLEAVLDEVASAASSSVLVRVSDVYLWTTGDPMSNPNFELGLGMMNGINGRIREEAMERSFGIGGVFARFNGEDGRSDPFAAGLLQEDGIHPSAAGLHEIAIAFAEAGLEPLDTTGDVDCSRAINAIDAALVLQRSAALLDKLTCPWAADVNEDDAENSLDAALILQYGAGLLTSLPP